MPDAIQRALGALVISAASPADLERIEAGALRRGLRSESAAVPAAISDRTLVNQWVTFLWPLFSGSTALNMTGTYSDDYGYSHGCMLPRNVEADFKRFLRSIGRSSVPWVLGIERHPSGRDVLHFHAMIGGGWDEAGMTQAAALWRHSRGWSCCRAVTNKAGATAYVTKHLMKQRGDDLVSFQVEPPRYGSRYERRAAERH